MSERRTATSRSPMRRGPRIAAEDARLKLGGAGGEAARAYYWHGGPPESITPAFSAGKNSDRPNIRRFSGLPKNG